MSAAWRTRILSLAGRIILENGGETYRAEDTVTRMARAMGMTEVDVFGIPSGLFISYTDECGERETSVCRIFLHGTHLVQPVGIGLAHQLEGLAGGAQNGAPLGQDAGEVMAGQLVIVAVDQALVALFKSIDLHIASEFII